MPGVQKKKPTFRERDLLKDTVIARLQLCSFPLMDLENKRTKGSEETVWAQRNGSPVGSATIRCTAFLNELSQ